MKWHKSAYAASSARPVTYQVVAQLGGLSIQDTLSVIREELIIADPGELSSDL